jgi:UDP-N-acetylglucosamine 1-carboxyvinyltransferase
VPSAPAPSISTSRASKRSAAASSCPEATSTGAPTACAAPTSTSTCPRSRISNAAREPEVEDLCRFLVTLGAKIEGIGTSTLLIEGSSRLTPASRPYRIVSDRIEAGTYLCAGAISGGEITVTDTDPLLMEATLAKLEEAGCSIERGKTSVTLRRSTPLRPFRVRTEPHPGLPTDMQAQLMAVACLANGTSIFEETIFENRFMHAAELARMGADISHSGRLATIRGTGQLQGAQVMASDLRASAALVLAGLAAGGITEVLRIYHLDRGYEKLVSKLRNVGARITRVSDSLLGVDKLKAALDAADRVVGEPPPPAEA